MDKKISPNRQRKEKIVALLTDKVSRSKGMVFINYQGLTHKQLEDLKKRVKAANAELVVTKNTLLKLALLNSKLEARNSKHLSVSDFQRPTATLFLYADPIEPLRQLAKTIKEFNLPFGLAQAGLAIKFGILDQEALTSEQVLKISALPSRQILLTQLVFSLKSPISRFHRSLNWNLQKFVMTLRAIESQNSKSQKLNSK